MYRTSPWVVMRIQMKAAQIRCRGYTLVEMLIVIAIIAILAAITVPVMLQVKETSRKNYCAGNMRQLGFAIARYIDDNNGYGLPQSPPEYENPWILCVLPLRSYIGQPMLQVRKGIPASQPKRIWICPGDLNRGSGANDRPYWWHCGSSYLYPGPTAYLSGKHPLQKHDTVARKPMLWRNHRRNILLADFWFDFHSGRKVKHEFEENSLTPPDWVSKLDVRSINIIFLDLHMTSVSARQREEYKLYTVSPDLDNPYPKETN